MVHSSRVHCLHTWRHYLLESKFIIKNDKVTTNHFQIQKKFTLKQAMWHHFLADFDYVMEYKPSWGNGFSYKRSSMILVNLKETYATKSRRGSNTIHLLKLSSILWRKVRFRDFGSKMACSSPKASASMFLHVTIVGGKSWKTIMIASGLVTQACTAD